MSTLTLPALDGRSPLGFLAALGMTRLLDVFTDDRPKLAWSPDDFTARLHSSRSSIDEVVADLQAVVDAIPADGVLPGVPATLPPSGEAPDRLRLPPEGLRRLVTDLTPEPDVEVEAWITSLVTDLSLDEKSRADISLMAAPSGKQSMYTMLAKPLGAVRTDPACLQEALQGWRRRSGVTGEYLDHRVLFDAADSGSGKSEERGVPGATWLALMSYPLLRTTAAGSEPVTTGWHRRHRQPPVFVYPLWSRPLDRLAIAALLEHPCLREALDRDIPGGSAAMTIHSVFRAQRRRIPGRTFAGVLGPVP